MIDYVVLHHKPLLDRKAFIQQKINEVGIVANFFTDYQLYNTEAYLSSLPKESLSLYLKHLHQLELKARERPGNILCVLEDDCAIPNNFKEISEKCAVEMIQNNYDIAFLGTCCNLHITVKNYQNILQYSPGLTTRCTHCYMVSTEGAKKAVTNTNIRDFNKPIDHKLNDVILESRLRCAWYEPGIPQSNQFKSSVPTSLGYESNIHNQ